MVASAGNVSAVRDSLDAFQHKDFEAIWTGIAGMAATGWAGVDNLIVSCFYVAAQKEWPGGPTKNQLTGFVRFLEERYDGIILVPSHTTEAVINSIFTGDYLVFDYVQQDAILMIQLVVAAAITAHRGIKGEKLSLFVESVARETARYRQDAATKG